MVDRRLYLRLYAEGERKRAKKRNNAFRNIHVAAWPPTSRQALTHLVKRAPSPIAYRLYLPEEWARDTARRKKAHIPDDVVFKTKPEIALDQIKYVDSLSAVLWRDDRVQPLKDYCIGLLMPGERKSVEPMAATVAPSRVSAKHQSLLHLVGQAAWSDEAVLDKVRELVLPAITTQGEIEA
ncbi:hypothetical protein MJC1_04160 [Methylocystis sp. MJC1]|nr:hypothetical protein MJC1_04160 [Methylocystis sp. MJC1]